MLRKINLMTTMHGFSKHLALNQEKKDNMFTDLVILELQLLERGPRERMVNYMKVKKMMEWQRVLSNSNQAVSLNNIQSANAMSFQYL